MGERYQPLEVNEPTVEIKTNKNKNLSWIKSRSARSFFRCMKTLEKLKTIRMAEAMRKEKSARLVVASSTRRRL